MANIKQQKKRILTDKKRNLRNKSFKSKIKTAIIKAKKAIQSNEKNKEELVSFAVKLLDKSITKKIRKRNYVNRKKSSLQKELNSSDNIVKE